MLVGQVDQRYYLSLLGMGAILVVAWVISQFHDDRPLRNDGTPSPNSPLAERILASSDTSEPRAVPAEAEPQRRLAEANGQPMIPGLLNDDSDSKREAGSSTTEPTPRATNGVPLRPVSSGTTSDEIFSTPSDLATIDEDGSSPRLRALPTFSMPNTQTPSGGSREPQDLKNAPPLPIGTQDPATVTQQSPPAPAGLRPIVSGDYRSLEAQAAEPQLLPGERHVLRPIIRAPAPAPSASAPAVASEFQPTPDSVWDTPMPGLKRRGSHPTGASSFGANPNEADSPSGETSGGFSNGLPAAVPLNFAATTSPTAAGTNDVSGDPLFKQVGASAGPGLGLASPDLGTGAPAPRSTLPSAPFTRGGLSATTGRSRPQSGDYIWHVIQQNQTIESISFQYQGDGSLVPRLLEMNRDLLTDPQLLPIGKPIRVPIR
jgi:nucleoid-associated protein YgaU